MLRGVQLSDIEDRVYLESVQSSSQILGSRKDYFYKENKETGMALIFFPLKNSLSSYIFREGREATHQ